jgi:hypothetical protein
MKIEEVPQDVNSNLGNSKIQEIAYAVDNDGNYCPIVSKGWEVKNDALDITWDDIYEECESVKKQVQAGQASPLAYHMVKNLMTVSLLSSYTGISKWRIKRHLKAKGFSKLSEEKLSIYADALRITVDELKKV